MSKYFEAVNSGGVTIIDDSIPRIYCRQVLRLSSCTLIYSEHFDNSYSEVSDENLGNYSFVFTIPLVSDDLFIAVRLTDTAQNFQIGVMSDLLSTNEARVALVGGVNSNLNDTNYLSYAHDVIIYIFSKGTLPQTTFGMACYDANGNMVFSSNAKLLSVVGKYYREQNDVNKSVWGHDLSYNTNFSATSLACVINCHMGHPAVGRDYAMCNVTYLLSVSGDYYVDRYFAVARKSYWQNYPYKRWLSSYSGYTNDWLFIDVSLIPLPS